MFDRIFDFFTSFLDLFKFWQIVYQYERAVLLRFGKRDREIGPGFHFIWPFNIHIVVLDNVVPRAIRLKEQSVTTADGQDIVLTPVVEWRIQDITLASLEVENLDTSLEAAVSGVIGDVVSAWEWWPSEPDAVSIRDGEFLEYVMEQTRAKAEKWGVDIIAISLADCCKAGSYRLWTGTSI